MILNINLKDFEIFMNIYNKIGSQTGDIWLPVKEYEIFTHSNINTLFEPEEVQILEYIFEN